MKIYPKILGPLLLLALAFGLPACAQPAVNSSDRQPEALLPISGENVNLQFDFPAGYILDGGQELCLIPNFSASEYPSEITASRTANGNYLIAFDYTISGAVTTVERQHVWLTAHGEQAYSAYETAWFTPLGQSLINGDKIWLRGDDWAYLIDDKAGQLQQIYSLHPLIEYYGIDETVRLVWADDDYALLKSDNNLWWAVLDLQTGNAKRIDEKLLSAEVKEQANEILWQQVKNYPLREDFASDAEYLAFFWQDLANRQYNLDAHLALDFAGADENRLNFQLKIFSENFEEQGSLDLSYQYK